MKTQDSLIAQLRDAKLGRIAAQVADLAMPSFRLQTTKMADEDIAVGASKLGGLPDLPPGSPWPSMDKTPLSFVAQINLEQLGQPSSAPAEGLLSFFYNDKQTAWGFDPKDRPHWQIMFMDASQRLERTRPPAHIAQSGLVEDMKKAFTRESDEPSVYAPLALSFVPFLSIPHGRSQALEDILMAEDESEEEEETYYKFRGAYPIKGPEHQLFGWPSPVQGEMELECQLASNGIYVGDPAGYRDPRAATLKANASDWTLLLQIDSDEDAQMMWGDCGMIYFWIRRTDLEQRRFDKAWLILQCS